MSINVNNSFFCGKTPTFEINSIQTPESFDVASGKESFMGHMERVKRIGVYLSCSVQLKSHFLSSQ